ncbi:MAG: hypothetical protein Kow00109_09200 [Acidobacteriota bacterium]
MSRISRLIVLVAWVLALGSPGFAQLADISDSPVFSGDSVLFDFDNYFDGSAAGSLLKAWGVLARGQQGSTPKVKTYVLAGTFNNVIANVPPDGSDSAGRALVLEFLQPVTKVGFTVGFGVPTGSQLSLQAFAPDGELLGEVTKSVGSGDTVAVSTSHPEGIAKLLISLGNGPDPEEIDRLQLEFVTRDAFQVYLAQVGNGEIPGFGALRTTIVVTNLSASTAQAELSFFKSDGTPLSLRFAGTQASELDLEIRPGASVALTTEGPELGVGYARITSRVPVEATAIFRVVGEDGLVVTEAGVGSAQAAFLQTGAVQKENAQAFDSGIAVVNTGDTAAAVVIELLNESGNVVATNSSGVHLGPGQHTAAFLSQLFPGIANSDFRGSVRLTSAAPIAAVILRTKTGLVYSSLPVGSTER